MELQQRPTIFLNEDQPRFVKVQLVPYAIDAETQEVSALFLKFAQNEQNLLSTFSGNIKEEDPSIFYSAARSMIIQSAGYLPFQDFTQVRPEIGKWNDVPYFRNEGVEKIFHNILNDDSTVIYNQNDSVYIWFHLESNDEEQLKELNLVTINHQLPTIHTLKLSDSQLLSQLDSDAQQMMNLTLQFLIQRLSSPPRKPEIAIVVSHGNPNWVHSQEGINMGHLMDTGLEKWKMFNAVEFNLPTDEDLQTIKVILFPGSGYSAYEDLPFIHQEKEFIQKVMNNYPHIKMMGICFGHQVLAHSLGGSAQRMKMTGDMPRAIGREKLLMTDEMHSQGFMESFKQKYNYNEDTLPYLVLQETHGDHVAILPENGTLLASSESCGVEMYCIGNRVFAMQGHPDINTMMMQTIIAPHYKTNGVLSEYQYNKATKLIDQTNHGRETRHTIYAMMREFMSYQE